MSKYYEAYDIRYRQVHEKGLTWAVDNNTELVEKHAFQLNLYKEALQSIYPDLKIDGYLFLMDVKRLHFNYYNNRLDMCL